MAGQTSFFKCLKFIAAAVLYATLSAPAAWAQSEEGAEQEASDTTDDLGGILTPEARAVLDRMTATFQGMKKYAVTASITRDEVLSYGYKLQNTESARMWIDGPTRLRMEVEGDIKNRSYYYDGAKLTMYVPDLNVYAVSPAPGTIGDLVELLLDAGIEMPLMDMLYQGNAGNLADSVKIGLVVGESEIDGVRTDHLAFRQADVDWQLWVQKGANALPRKLLITTRYEVGDPQYQAVLRWDLNPKANAKSFAFVAPAGAVEIPAHTKLVAEGGAE